MFISDKVIFGSCSFIFFPTICSCDAKDWKLLFYIFKYCLKFLLGSWNLLCQF
ncbi:hypothetical protein RLOC_00006481 [Lonchura striata]|uniref:Uncharacterized protein n=1 Tax=Lonchura striata TaxID=40157 RepID=A0A218US02_9PASE|nr:hypothetical protein RLOC_00006481 [Lonchura striata domestica]